MCFSIKHNFLTQWERQMYMGRVALSSSTIHQLCDGLDKKIFQNFPPLRGREIYDLSKREIWRIIRKRSHAGSCAEVRHILPSTTEDCTPIVPGPVVGTYGTYDRFLTPFTPTPIQRIARICIARRGHMYWWRKIVERLSTSMYHSITIESNFLQIWHLVNKIS